MLKYNNSPQLAFYSVYKLTFPDGKVYIGMTSLNPEQRWHKGKGYPKSTLIRKATDKFDWNDVKREILYEKLTERKAHEKETEMILKHSSNNPEYGYNVSIGAGNTGVKMSSEARRKMSQDRKGAKSLRARQIDQVDLSGNLIRRWDYMGQINEELGYARDRIIDSCRGRITKAYGCIWEYADRSTDD